MVDASRHSEPAPLVVSLIPELAWSGSESCPNRDEQSLSQSFSVLFRTKRSRSVIGEELINDLVQQ